MNQVLNIYHGSSGGIPLIMTNSISSWYAVYLMTNGQFNGDNLEEIRDWKLPSMPPVGVMQHMAKLQSFYSKTFHSFNNIPNAKHT